MADALNEEREERKEHEEPVSFAQAHRKLASIEERLRKDEPLDEDISELRNLVVELTKGYPVSDAGLNAEARAEFSGLLDRIRDVIALVQLKQKVISGELRKIAGARAVKENYPEKKDTSVPTFVDTRN